MSKLVLLRHGESVWNAQNKFTGWIDVGLTEKGKKQAKQAGLLLKEKGFVFDIAFTSVLQRAIETLEIVLDKMGLLGIAVQKAWQLNERHYGALQGMNKKEAVKKFGLQQLMAWRRGYKAKPPALARVSLNKKEPKSESLEDVFLRVVPYWRKKIAPHLAQGNNVLVVAHGNSLRALVKFLDNLSDEEIEKVNIPLVIPLVYEFDKSMQVQHKYYLASPQKVARAAQAVQNEIR